ncbi:MAG: RICIN domain-containing protein [Sphingobacteriaceae bacterium]
MNIFYVSGHKGILNIIRIALKRHTSSFSTPVLVLFLSFSIGISGCKKGTNENPDNTEEPQEKPIEPKEDNFTIVVMPDTQHYMAGYFGGTYDMFTSQIDWIIRNKDTHNIAYVAVVGDMVEHGDDPYYAVSEWPNVATKGYHRLEAHNIPYGVAVGNHDQWQGDWGTSILKVTTTNFNKYFGRDRFAKHSYYGGNFEGPSSNKNNSHYDLFTAGGKDFMVIYLEFDALNELSTQLNDWAYNLCTTYASRKVIIVTHYAIQVGDSNDYTKPAPWGTQGFRIWNRLKDRPNVFMMLGGHVYGPGPEYIGEGYREDTYNGNTIRSYLANYQMRGGGGNGLLRLMKFSVANDEVTVKTYSPFSNAFEKDVSSEFTKPLFGPVPSASIPNGKYKIVPKQGENTGKALATQNASLSNMASVVQQDYTASIPTNDEWNLSQIGSSGYYRITNANSNLDMNVLEASIAVGGVIGQLPYPAAGNAKNDEWALIPTGGNYYKVIARHSGLSLNIAGEGTTNGAALNQSTYQKKDSQIFQFVPIP